MATTFAIDGGVDAAKFSIDATTGKLTFKVAPDFENPTDANKDNVYEVVIRATDVGGASSTQAMRVTVTDVSENAPPQITSAGEISVKENQTIVITVTAVDPDDNTPPINPPTSGAWPGQADNRVGYLNVPATKPTFTAPTTWPTGATWPGAYPGSLKAAVTITSGTASAPRVYAFYDFGSRGVPSNTHDVVFVGCLFSMTADSFPVMVGGASCAKVSFFYCSVTPNPTVVSQPPNGGGYTTWPTGGWCTNEGPNNSHQIRANQGYNTGFELWDHPLRQAPAGLIQIDHCDMWGGGCSISVGLDLPGGGNITDNWLHDFASGDPLGWHTNGIANSNEHEMLGANPVVIRHNVIAGFGLSNAVAFQNTFVGIFKNITIDNNFISGWGGIPIRLCTGSGITEAQYAQLVAKIVFTNNVLSTGTRPINAWLYGGDHPKIFLGNNHANGSRWSNNKLQIEPGTTPHPDLYPAYTNAQNGQFLHPDNIFRPADFT